MFSAPIEACERQKATVLKSCRKNINNNISSGQIPFYEEGCLTSVQMLMCLPVIIAV